MSDEMAGMKAGLDGLVREQAERRSLREQQGEEIKAKSQEYMTKQVQAAERYVQHVREMANRKTKSGWGVRDDSGGPQSFEPEGFAGEQGAGAAAPFAPTPAPPSAPAEPRRGRRHRAADTDDDDGFGNNPW
ncbi:hypothetical protein [Amycolatopsis sp. NBC_01286]|uniref:hypothetical protein n=1 Tax=Amycolatopsis sp. NBC_01286 TaxID=2903560 RepID=UPI002E0FA918|nr:hypothetical protein OG570_38410 [Amycolatopsis sp. NBC_01286]